MIDAVTAAPAPRLPWPFLAFLCVVVVVLSRAIVVGEALATRRRPGPPPAAAPAAVGSDAAPAAVGSGAAPAPRPAVEAPDPGRPAPATARLAPGPWRVVLGLAPVTLLVLALFHPAVLAWLRAQDPRRVAALGGGVALWTFLAPAQWSLTARNDHPYVAALVALGAAVPLLALRVDPRPGRLTSLGLLVWLAWWVPFDLRWTGGLWLGPPGLAYAAPALLVTALALLAFGVVARPHDEALEPFRPPTGRDALVALQALGALALLVVPLGVAAGFLPWPPHAPRAGAARLVLEVLGIGLTVALPEEVYFRAVLDQGLRARLGPAASLAASSLAFGLMHWNNRGRLEEQAAYVLLAAVAGALYGGAYRRAGLWAAVLCHTLVDVLWKALL